MDILIIIIQLTNCYHAKLENDRTRITRVRTMTDKIMNTPGYDKQYYPFCGLNHLVKKLDIGNLKQRN